MTDQEFHLLLTLTGTVLVSMALIYVYAGFIGVVVVATLVDAALRWIETQRSLRSGAQQGQRDR